MTRSQALLAASMVTAVAVAFVVGAGARSGAFGLGSVGFGAGDASVEVPVATAADAPGALQSPPPIATVGTRRAQQDSLERRFERSERRGSDGRRQDFEHERREHDDDDD